MILPTQLPLLQFLWAYFDGNQISKIRLRPEVEICSFNKDSMNMYNIVYIPERFMVINIFVSVYAFVIN